MFRQMPVSVLALAALAGAEMITLTAVNNAFGSTSCETKYATGVVPLVPIPSKYGYAVTTEVMTDPVGTTTTVSFISAPAVTTTAYTSTEVAVVIATTTLPVTTATWRETVEIGRASLVATSCSNRVVPTATETVYTGAYTPISGQQTVWPSQHPTLIDCTVALTQKVTLRPFTVVKETRTTTPTFVVNSFTTTSTSTFTYGTETTHLSTVSVKGDPTHTAGLFYSTTYVECAKQTKTVTLPAKCAPTNLISSFNGKGLGPDGDFYRDKFVTPASGDVVSGRWETDLGEYGAVGCCQACANSKTCAGMAYRSRSQQVLDHDLCSLWFTFDGKCGTDIFSYNSTSVKEPARGLVVQAGCGLIKHEE